MAGLDALRFFAAPSKETRRLAAPTATYQSVLEISFELCFKRWNIISEWDGVWVPHGGQPDKTALGKLEEAVASCKSVSILSNCEVIRGLEVAEQLEGTRASFFRAEPKKPHPEAFYRVLRQLQLSPHEMTTTAYIGDRIFTDIYGARRAGFAHVLKVLPYGTKEPLRLKVARTIENFRYAGRN